MPPNETKPDSCILPILSPPKSSIYYLVVEVEDEEGN